MQIKEVQQSQTVIPIFFSDKTWYDYSITASQMLIETKNKLEKRACFRLTNLLLSSLYLTILSFFKLLKKN